MANDTKITLNTEEIVLGTLVLMTPKSIHLALIANIKMAVSIKAGEEAEKVLEEITRNFSSEGEYLRFAAENTSDELKGEKEAMSSLTQVFAAVILGPDQAKKLFEEMGIEAPVVAAPGRADASGFSLDGFFNRSPEAFAVPTPGCSCPRCTVIKELAEEGKRVKNDGTVVEKEDMH